MMLARGFSTGVSRENSVSNLNGATDCSQESVCLFCLFSICLEWACQDF